MDAVGNTPSVGEDPVATDGLVTYDQIEPLFETQCVVCHNFEEPEDAVDLSDYFLAVDHQEQIGIRVATDNMPPATSEQRLTEEEKQLILDWVKAGCPE